MATANGHAVDEHAPEPRERHARAGVQFANAAALRAWTIRHLDAARAILDDLPADLSGSDLVRVSLRCETLAADVNRLAAAAAYRETPPPPAPAVVSPATGEG